MNTEGGCPSIDNEAVIDVWGEDGCELGVVMTFTFGTAERPGVDGIGFRNDKKSCNLHICA